MKRRSFSLLMLLLVAATLMCGRMSAQTQAELNWYKSYKAYPYAFVSMQGGAQTLLSQDLAARKLFQPNVAVSAGAMFTPYIGARFNVSGWKSKSYLSSLERKYAFKYVGYNLDLLLNASQFFGKSSYKDFNVFLIAGLGLNQGVSNKQMRSWVDAGLHNSSYPWRHRVFYSMRFGLQLEKNLTRWLAVNVECSANNFADRFNSIANGHGDWQLQVMAGLTFKFGHKKNPYHDPTYGVEDTPELLFEETAEDTAVEEAVADDDESEADDEEEASPETAQ